MNKYTGEVELELGGKVCKLVYDWRAISEIQTRHGNEMLKNLFSGISPDIVADILAIGFKKLNPEMTKDAILDLSPPFVPMIQALDKALSYAYFGGELPKEAGAADQGEEKKTVS